MNADLFWLIFLTVVTTWAAATIVTVACVWWWLWHCQTAEALVEWVRDQLEQARKEPPSDDWRRELDDL